MKQPGHAEEPRSLRPFQAAFVRAALAKIELPDRADRVVVGDICPGSGKTLCQLLAADALFRRGLIDAVAIFVPRLNLARQAEADWNADRRAFAAAVGAIRQADNVAPLMRNKGFGYIATYQSLLSEPRVHEDFVHAQRTLVIFDEAQVLGADGPGGQGTRSADWARRLGDGAALVCVLSGTPYRSDGAPLLFARYGAADPASGLRPLIADVRATYLDGVRQRYLRPIEAELYDGRGWWQAAGADPETPPATLELSQLERGLHRVLRQPEFWQPLVDRAAAKITLLQRELDPRMRGLIAAADQAHAKEIAGYLRRTHPGVKALLATQDEVEAQRNLDRFREGRGDIMVTCAMAHVGYDHKPIAVVLPLTTTRQEGWLRQLVARGMRMLLDLDPDAQICYLIVPDDPQMRRFVTGLRGESVAGVLAREPRDQDPGSGGGPASVGGGIPAGIGVGLGAEVTGMRIQGLDPDGDAGAAELARIEALRHDCGISLAFPVSKLVAFARRLGGGDPPPLASPPAPAATNPAPRPAPAMATTRDREQALRVACARAAVRCDATILTVDPSWPFGGTNRLVKAHFGKPAAACGEDELRERLAYIKDYHRAAGRKRD